MSTTPIREDTTTPNLQLPIPGDERTADYVTFTDALARKIDQMAAPASGLIALTQRVLALEQGGGGGNGGTPIPTPVAPDFITNGVLPAASDGKEVYFLVPGGNAVWHLRCRPTAGTYPWEFLGGLPVTSAWGDASIPLPLGTSANHQLFGSTGNVPLPGIYQAKLTTLLDMPAPGGVDVRVFLGGVAQQYLHLYAGIWSEAGSWQGPLEWTDTLTVTSTGTAIRLGAKGFSVSAAAVWAGLTLLPQRVGA